MSIMRQPVQEMAESKTRDAAAFSGATRPPNDIHSQNPLEECHDA